MCRGTLATREAVGEVKRVLTDEGIYVVNLLDYGGLAYARAGWPPWLRCSTMLRSPPRPTP